ncbi:MAG: hypothetical protein WAK55_00855 [Xanthobacteraceae bacterium]
MAKLTTIILSVVALLLALVGADAQQFPNLPAASYLSGTTSAADTSTSAVSLTPSTGKTAYVCGFSIGGPGATAISNVSATLAVASGNLSYAYSMPAGVTVAAVPVGATFNPCQPGPAGSAITLTVPGAAGNTSTVISLWGFQQ